MIQGVAKLCENLLARLDAAVDTFLSAVVDRITAAWAEEGE